MVFPAQNNALFVSRRKHALSLDNDWTIFDPHGDVEAGMQSDKGACLFELSKTVAALTIARHGVEEINSKPGEACVQIYDSDDDIDGDSTMAVRIKHINSFAPQLRHLTSHLLVSLWAVGRDCRALLYLLLLQRVGHERRLHG